MIKNIVMIRNPFRLSDFGGGEKYPVALGSELKKYGIKTTVLSGCPNIIKMANDHNINVCKTPWLRLQNYSGWKIIFVPIYIVWEVFLSLYYYFFLQKLHPNVVHIHSRDDFIAASFVCNILHIPVIWTDHGDLAHVLNNLQHPIKNPIGKLVYWSMRYAKKVITVSANELDLVLAKLPEKSPQKEKILTIYNGVNYVKTKRKTNVNKFVFAIMSRIVVDKGIAEAMEAFTSLNRKNTELWIIGDGKDRQMLESNNHNKNIKFFGYLESPLETLAKADCLLAPSYNEALGLSIIEASMLGLTIIASNTGGIPEIVTNNFNGLLVTPKKSSSLKKAMENILDNPKLAKTLAKNAKKVYLKKFSFANIVVKEIIPLYNTLLDD